MKEGKGPAKEGVNGGGEVEDILDLVPTSTDPTTCTDRQGGPERYPNNRNKTVVARFHLLGYFLWVREAASARRSGTGSSRSGHVGFVCVCACLWDREMGRNLGGMRVGLDGFDTVERVMSREKYGF